MKEKIVLCWSGGKDSALALDLLLKSYTYEVVALVTTCTQGFNRISMHGVRSELLEEQARAIGLPLVKVYISQNSSNAEYEAKMSAAFCEFKKEGITTIAFGDLFLEEIRAYRDRMLGQIGFRAIYPVWGKDTTALAHDFINRGFNATLVCIDPRKLDNTFAGRNFDLSLLGDLPTGVDPCGENGEFHTFVFQAPFFRRNIPCTTGEVVERGGFCFCDLLSATEAQPHAN